MPKTFALARQVFLPLGSLAHMHVVHARRDAQDLELHPGLMSDALLRE